MFALHTLRQSRLLLRAVLLWFALSLGVAFASPLMKPISLVDVCTAAGDVLQVSVGDESAPAKPHTLECNQCLPYAAPAPTGAQLNPPQAFPVEPGDSVPTAHIPVRSASPLDARGPPAIR